MFLIFLLQISEKFFSFISNSNTRHSSNTTQNFSLMTFSVLFGHSLRILHVVKRVIVHFLTFASYRHNDEKNTEKVRSLSTPFHYKPFTLLSFYHVCVDFRNENKFVVKSKKFIWTLTRTNLRCSQVWLLQTIKRNSPNLSVQTCIREKVTLSLSTPVVGQREVVGFRRSRLGTSWRTAMSWHSILQSWRTRQRRSRGWLPWDQHDPGFGARFQLQPSSRPSKWERWDKLLHLKKQILCFWKNLAQ